MKILSIHSFYQIKGGEDAVFEQEAAILQTNNNVKLLTFRNSYGLKGAFQFLSSIWNMKIAGQVREEIKRFQPDVVHIHNWHFAVGPLIIRTCHKLSVPVVLTLHNYRLLCPSGTLLVDGRIFLDSVHASFPWSAIKEKVYRDSLLLTFWLSFIVWFHKKIGTWNKVSRFIVLTPFAKSLFENSSLQIPAYKFILKPNFTTATLPPITESAKRKDYFLFIGRLSEEKGIKLLLDAFKGLPYQLRIAGEGPLLQEVQKACINGRIEYLGKLNNEQIQAELRNCSALVFPSIWYEPFGLVLIEALSAGTPVIASNFGGIPSIIKDGINGLHFQVNDPKSMIKTLNDWNRRDQSEKDLMRLNARRDYEELYTSEQNEKLLTEIYKSVL